MSIKTAPSFLNFLDERPEPGAHPKAFAEFYDDLAATCEGLAGGWVLCHEQEPGMSPHPGNRAQLVQRYVAERMGAHRHGVQATTSMRKGEPWRVFVRWCPPGASPEVKALRPLPGVRKGRNPASTSDADWARWVAVADRLAEERPDWVELETSPTRISGGRLRTFAKYLAKMDGEYEVRARQANGRFWLEGRCLAADADEAQEVWLKSLRDERAAAKAQIKELKARVDEIDAELAEVDAAAPEPEAVAPTAERSWVEMCVSRGKFPPYLDDAGQVLDGYAGTGVYVPTEAEVAEVLAAIT